MFKFDWSVPVSLEFLEENIKNSSNINWTHISKHQKLSEEFIQRNSDRVDWDWISAYQKLSEEFIQRNSEKVNWDWISKYQKLSEEFIQRNSEKVNWVYISIHQKLSEEFIQRNSDKVGWNHIGKYQKLSEEFIQRNSEKVNWNWISMYQKLSEEFIQRNSEKVNWYRISMYQKLSDEFIQRNSDRLIKDFKNNNWLYKSPEERLEEISKSKLYEIEGDFVIAYKGIRKDRYSKYNFQYQYLVGETYECHADFNVLEENSFGLSAWTLEEAKKYCNELVIKVKIHKDDLAALVHSGGKIRCQKFQVLEDIL
jgi:hypothetical protein